MVSHVNRSDSYIFCEAQKGAGLLITKLTGLQWSQGVEKGVDESVRISSGIFGMVLMISVYVNISPSCGVEDVTQHWSTQSCIV